MGHDTGETAFSATSGEVKSLLVTTDYGPLPDPLPALSGVWVGRCSLPSHRDRYATFALLLTQEGRAIKGVSLNPPGKPEQSGTVALVADWTDGKVSAGGGLAITKTYRDHPAFEPIRYEGQVNADMRSMGGAWRSLDGQAHGTFVAYKVCRLQGWGL
jgi:hypothetical protein